MLDDPVSVPTLALRLHTRPDTQRRHTSRRLLDPPYSLAGRRGLWGRRRRRSASAPRRSPAPGEAPNLARPNEYARLLLICFALRRQRWEARDGTDKSKFGREAFARTSNRACILTWISS